MSGLAVGLNDIGYIKTLDDYSKAHLLMRTRNLHICKGDLTAFVDDPWESVHSNR